MTAQETYETCLDNLAYHVQLLTEMKPGETIRMGLGDEMVTVCRDDRGLYTLNGRDAGNQYGARRALMAYYAPVLLGVACAAA